MRRAERGGAQGDDALDFTDRSHFLGTIGAPAGSVGRDVHGACNLVTRCQVALHVLAAVVDLVGTGAEQVMVGIHPLRKADDGPGEPRELSKKSSRGSRPGSKSTKKGGGDNRFNLVRLPSKHAECTCHASRVPCSFDGILRIQPDDQATVHEPSAAGAVSGLLVRQWPNRLSPTADQAIWAGGFDMTSGTIVFQRRACTLMRSVTSSHPLDFSRV